MTATDPISITEHGVSAVAEPGTEVPGDEAGGFLAAPPFAFPAMPWKPEYGTIDDDGDITELGGGLFVYGSPDFTLDVNSLCAITDDGVVVFDTQIVPLHAQRIVDEIRSRTDQPIRYAVNSHQHPDHVFGNAVFEEAGAEIVSSHFTARMIYSTATADFLFLMGMYGEYAAPRYVVPKRTFVRSKELWLGSTVVHLFEFADSTTLSGEAVTMTMSWLPEQKVLHVGDTLEPGSHCFFSEGVSVPDWIAQLDHVRELVDELRPEVIVPGHGLPGDATMIDDQERYLLTVAGIVEDHTGGGEHPVDPETCERMRRDIVAEFPTYTNPIPLDVSLDMMQMLGPVAFLNGRPDAATARRLPSFR